MNFLTLIEKHKNKQTLTKEELSWIVDNFISGNIKDYQMSAFLMSIFYNSLTDQEAIDLTLIMKNSGFVFNKSEIDPDSFICDKHSTGGVGDKISLIYSPLATSLGLRVFKMSGRGLDISGGTIDKLESIPGLNLNLSNEQMIEIYKKNGFLIAMSNKALVPADAKIYALRDITGTVDSIPLIASSIMSKKLALDPDGILLDIKVGKGAFMPNIEKARELAKLMYKIGISAGKKMHIMFSNMNRPLGRAIGNLLEIFEVIEVLKGKGDPVLIDLASHSVASSLLQAGKCKNMQEGQEIAKAKLSSGEAFVVFEKFVESLGGSLEIFESMNIDEILKSQKKYEIKADKDGYVEIIDARAFGFMQIGLGAQRKNKETKINYSAGTYINKTSGEWVKKGDTVITLYTAPDNDFNLDEDTKSSLFRITSNKPEPSNIIIEEMF